MKTDKNVRVRFAPSPTGYLHIGGARTALFNWLYARHTGGTFILRIEDTDTARNSQEAVEVILKGLRWLGLDWDEGPLTGDASGPSQGDHGPYFQSQRMPIYQRRIQELLSQGHAYEHEGAIKFRMSKEPTILQDLVVGKVVRELTDREQLDPDFVIVRSDGQPVFHLVNVVDDLEMGITHVIRGEDHLANTAKHMALFRAFGAEPPRYAHIPLILNKDGSKMSKRDQGASLMTYEGEGYAPEAVVNYLFLLGWSPKGNREILSLKEAVSLFDLPQILRHNARFDLTKLKWMNGEYIRAMSPERFQELALPALAQAGIPTAGYDSGYVRSALYLAREKIKVFTDLPGFVDFFFTQEVRFDPELFRQEMGPDRKRCLEHLRKVLAVLHPFTADVLGQTFKKTAADLNVHISMLVQPARLACTGRLIGPSLYHLMEVLGPQEVLRRMDLALSQCPS